MGLVRHHDRLVAMHGKLVRFPNVVQLVMNVFNELGYWYNRAIDKVAGNQRNPIMGSYLLAATDNIIAITGFLATDTVHDYVSDIELTNISKANGAITLTYLEKYSAFKIKRSGVVIGEYMLTERQGSRLINRFRGDNFLANGTLTGTLTTIWGKANKYYSSSNIDGYSIAGTGWFADAGLTQSLTTGTFIPADLVNTTKCLAWTSGGQQDLQFLGRSKNNMAVIPYSFYCNADRHWNGNTYGATVTTHKLTVYCVVIKSATAGVLYGSTGNVGSTTVRSLILPVTGTLDSVTVGYYSNKTAYVSLFGWYGDPLKIEGGYNNGLVYTRVTNLKTGEIRYTEVQYTVGQQVIASSQTRVASSNTTLTQRFTGYISRATEEADGVIIDDFVNCQHTTNMYDLVAKTTHALQGVSTDIYQNVDLFNLSYVQTGYEIWTNGSDYRIYPLASDGTRFITPAGYTIVETVAAGNMPAVADLRLSTFKYSLPNSYECYSRVPEAYNTDSENTAKVLSYSELLALNANSYVTLTESNNKISNFKILK